MKEMTSYEVRFGILDDLAEETHDQEVMKTFNSGSLMQEHSSKLIRPMSLISHLLKGVGSLNYLFIFLSLF